MAESQFPFPYTPADVASLSVAISTPRFATYLQRAGGDQLYAFSLYLYNARLAKAFLFPLHVVEVTLRNAIDESLMAAFGPHWPFDQNVQNRVLTPDGLKTLEKAIERAGRGATKDDIVATLTFDFWSNLFKPDYGVFWRTKLNVVLPNLPRGVTRHDIQAAVREINRLRNRIAHHEPILDLNAVEIMGGINKVVSYRCATTQAWMRHYATVAQVLRTRPDAQGAQGVRLSERQDPNILRVTGAETLTAVLQQLNGRRTAIVRIDGRGAPTGACSGDDILPTITAEAAKADGLLSISELNIDTVLGPPGPASHWATLADNQAMSLAVDVLRGPLIKVLVGVDAASGRATGAILRAHRRY